ncbi:conserved oligomeric Golgi complex subunit 7 [Zerene cesonia]|uniref:conserved oligomeric Golgi complex subunit 7 n=1 Tax=Zerene cesonia TaxID=33412 RepID=UPI0018E54EE2|nr:conserved oligomeric Golgi complex subunit 7 [Zerene cesonia]
MDLKTFAENDFSPKDWINRAWNISENQEKEIFVANTVTRLQLYMKQLSNSLDETTTQILTSVPRVLQDVQSLQLEGSLLQQKLMTLERQVESVEEETGQSIESLQRIDQLKSRLENAASALREADKWAALATSLEDILEAGIPAQVEKLNELADLVVGMTDSLEVLSDAPDYEKKCTQLELLYNRLEAAISPPFIEALTQMDAERTTPYVCVYRGMSRAASAQRCWRRAAAARHVAAWRRLDAHSLRALTRMLVGDVGRQVEWLTTVLKSETPVSELIKLYTDLLLSLDPSPTKIVTANFKLCQNAEEGISMLTDLKSDIDEFIDCIMRIIDGSAGKENISDTTLKELGKVAYAPLRELMPNYTELQTQLFLAYLNDPQLKQENLLEYSRAVQFIAERSDARLNSAYLRGKKIAGDAIQPYFAPAMETYITAILNLITTHTRHIEATFLSLSARGQHEGVLSEGFSASLILETATGILVDLLVERTAAEIGERKDAHPLYDLFSILDQDAREISPSPSLAGLRRARDTLKALARTILRHPVDVQLDKIPQLSVWYNNDALSTDLPDFALSPQEYITEIGQYLMTLPQHLELHLSEKQAPWQFLAEVCTYTCEMYAEKIINIRNMDPLGTKRCLTDIVYLSSVVEDLGTNVTPALKNLEKSLRAATSSQQ